MVDLQVVEAFVVRLNEMIAAHDAAQFSALHPRRIVFEAGKRYVRLVMTNASGTQRSAYGFVDLENGDLLKAASWKGPAKNFSRGNVLRDGLKGCGGYGVG